MTPLARTHFYFPAWSQLARARAWRTKDGRLLASPPAADQSAATLPDQLLRLVWTAAAQLARRDLTALKPDHLRHAVTIVALKRDKSSRDFTDDEADRVVTLMRLLADPDNLDHLQSWLDPDIARRRRLEWRARQVPPAYIAQLSADKFGTRNWQSLTTDQLRQLVLTLRHRAPRDVRRAPARQTHQLEPADCPF
jgi:hypothetical protein